MVYVTSRPLYPLEITSVPTERKAELTQGMIWTGAGGRGKVLTSPRFDPRTAHIIAIRYTD